jgi:hypothetical protein
MEGFVQKVHCAGGKGACALVVVYVGCDEDDRDMPVGRTQMTLEIESAHTRHPYIENQARRVVYVLRTEKRFRGREALRPKADGAE